MAFSGFLFVIALLIHGVCAQPAVFYVSNVDSVDVGTWTDHVSITASVNPMEDVTITAEAPAEVMLSQSTFTFTPSTRSMAFRATSTTAGSFIITFNKHDPAAQFHDLATMSVSFNLRKVWIDEFPMSVYVNQPSERIQISVSTASDYDLIFVPNHNIDGLSFSPAKIIIKAGTRSASFTYSGSSEVGADFLIWDIQGPDVALYDTESIAEHPFTVEYNIIRRPFTLPSDPIAPVLVGFEGYNGLYVYTQERPNADLTVTPQAADTVFHPTTAQLGDTQSVFFTYTTNTTGTKNIYFFSSGPGAEDYTRNPLQPVQINVPKRRVIVALSSVHVVTNTSYMSLSIPAPSANGIIVSFTAANVKFNVSSVEFKGNETSCTVALQIVSLGYDTVYFALSGPDSDYYTTIDDIQITTIAKANFIIAEYGFPRLIVGAESEKIPLRTSVSPISQDGVSLTPTAPGLIFHPSTLTFSNGTEQQYFTITPSYSRLSGGYHVRIEWLLSGTDAPWFQRPSSLEVPVYKRNFEVVWSSHLLTDKEYTYFTRFLHKTYKVWISASHVGQGEHVSITPVSAYWTFKPEVLNFHAPNAHVELEATLTGIPANYADVVIDYVIGGKDGGLYNPIPHDTFHAALRPLEFAAAVISPDERTKGILITEVRSPPYTFDPLVLRQNHVHSFLIRSLVLPDEDLTITPHSPHVKFSPSKITIKVKNAAKRADWHPVLYLDDAHGFVANGMFLEANFTAKAEAPGTHMVWFELSGKDKDYYTRLSHTPMTFRLVSISSHLFLSLTLPVLFGVLLLL
jgi:hypothetical protein